LLDGFLPVEWMAKRPMIECLEENYNPAESKDNLRMKAVAASYSLFHSRGFDMDAENCRHRYVLQ
jgi:hypothetical protein